MLPLRFLLLVTAALRAAAVLGVVLGLLASLLPEALDRTRSIATLAASGACGDVVGDLELSELPVCGDEELTVPGACLDTAVGRPQHAAAAVVRAFDDGALRPAATPHATALWRARALGSRGPPLPRG